jgi:hypothetical protein
MICRAEAVAYPGNPDVPTALASIAIALRGRNAEERERNAKKPNFLLNRKYRFKHREAQLFELGRRGNVWATSFFA